MTKLRIRRHLLEPGGGPHTPGGSLDFGYLRTTVTLLLGLLTISFGVHRFANTLYYTGDIAYLNLTGPVYRYWQVPIDST